MYFSAIKKRDGNITGFDAAKITAAILKAGKATGEFEEREARRLTMRVLSMAKAVHLPDPPDVESIQDVVEQVLLDSPFRATAKAYILYREQRTQLRRIKTKANVELMEGYLNKMDWRVRENSNMGFSLQGLNNYIASDITSEYWLNRIYTPAIYSIWKQPRRKELPTDWPCSTKNSFPTWFSPTAKQTALPRTIQISHICPLIFPRTSLTYWICKINYRKAIRAEPCCMAF